jgi:hypothetical protein
VCGGIWLVLVCVGACGSPEREARMVTSALVRMTKVYWSGEEREGDKAEIGEG